MFRRSAPFFTTEEDLVTALLRGRLTGLGGYFPSEGEEERWLRHTSSEEGKKLQGFPSLRPLALQCPWSLEWALHGIPPWEEEALAFEVQAATEMVPLSGEAPYRLAREAVGRGRTLVTLLSQGLSRSLPEGEGAWLLWRLSSLVMIPATLPFVEALEAEVEGSQPWRPADLLLKALRGPLLMGAVRGVDEAPSSLRLYALLGQELPWERRLLLLQRYGEGRIPLPVLAVLLKTPALQELPLDWGLPLAEAEVEERRRGWREKEALSP